MTRIISSSHHMHAELQELQEPSAYHQEDPGLLDPPSLPLASQLAQW